MSSWVITLRYLQSYRLFTSTILFDRSEWNAMYKRFLGIIDKDPYSEQSGVGGGIRKRPLCPLYKLITACNSFLSHMKSSAERVCLHFRSSSEHDRALHRQNTTRALKGFVCYTCDKKSEIKTAEYKALVRKILLGKETLERSCIESLSGIGNVDVLIMTL